MKALVWRGPGPMRIEHRPERVVGPDDILLRVTAATIGGSDVAAYRSDDVIAGVWTDRGAPGEGRQE